MEPARERILNVPGALVATLGLLAVVHAVLWLVLNDAEVDTALRLFAFIPARYDSSLLPGSPYPGGWAADLWTFVTYALIHADFSHLFFNGIWLLAFGTPVARRFGTSRFLLFLVVTSAAGAAAHLVTHTGDPFPMVGASAAVSGAMAAAIRFAFQRGGPLALWRIHDEANYWVPAASLGQSLRDSRVLAFLAVWLGLNILLGLGTLALPGATQSVAWQAHIGGFAVGLIGFSLFDPVQSPTDVDGKGTVGTGG